MLAITLPHVDAWNVWFSDTANSPAGVPPLRALVDDACRAVGRDPAEVERTVAVQVRMPGGTGRIQGAAREPLSDAGGQPGPHRRRVCGRTPREGIGHVQLVVDPIDRRRSRGSRRSSRSSTQG